MGERTRLRLVFLPTVSGEGGAPATVSPQERQLTAGWREELSGSLEPATPTTPKETTALWSADECSRSRDASNAPYKVLVVGDRGVGKSAIVARYITDTFGPSHDPTAGVRTSVKTGVSLEQGTCSVQITELSAERSFQGLADVFYKEAHGCLVVFDLGDRRSLRSALQWKHRIDELCSLRCDARFPSLLLANKCDVTKGRAVTQWEVEDVVKQAEFLTWIEVSAKYNFMIAEAIGYLLRVILSRVGPPEPTDTVQLGELDDGHSRSRSCCTTGSRTLRRSRAPQDARGRHEEL